MIRSPLMTDETTFNTRYKIIKPLQGEPPFLIRQWSDFYDIEQPTDSNKFFKNEQYQNIIDDCALSLRGDVYIVNCYFFSITYSDDGAAVHIGKSGTRFLIESSTFVECETTGEKTYGGALYISTADFAMNHVCAIQCKAAYRCSFTYIEEPGRTLNSINLSSAAYCVSLSYYTMRHYYGSVDIHSLNVSHNKASRYSSIRCMPDNVNKNNLGTNIDYSSFADNNATSQYCIYFEHEDSKTEANSYLICNSNIIRNIGDQTIYVEVGKLTIRNTCIMKNDGKQVFYQSSSNSITLIDCSVDDNIDSYNTRPNTESIGTISFIHGIKFIKTGSCVNIFDTLGDLTPSNMPTYSSGSKTNQSVNIIQNRKHIDLLICFLPGCLFLFGSSE